MKTLIAIAMVVVVGGCSFPDKLFEAGPGISDEQYAIDKERCLRKAQWSMDTSDWLIECMEDSGHTYKGNW